MALVPCVTNANPSLSLLGGGGGGGGGTSTLTATYTLEVSTLVSIVGGQTITVPNDLLFPAGSGALFGGGGVPDIQFQNSNGTITGLSTINGVPFGSSANISTNTTNGGYFGNIPVNLNPVPFNVTPDKWYNASISFLDMSVVGQPNETDNFNVSIQDQTGVAYLGNVFLKDVSTLRATNNSRGFSFSGPYEAISTIGNFVYTPNSNMSVSTFVTTTGVGWLSPLN